MSRFGLMLLTAFAGALAAPAPAAAATLPLESYRFTAVYHTPSTSAGGVERRVADFTPLGPIAGTIRDNSGPGRGDPVLTSLRPTHVAVDPRTLTHYGRFGGGTPSRFDRRSGALTNLPDVSPAEMSHPTGLTFDTTRNRLVVSTLGSEGYLLAYSPDSNRWSTIRSLDNVDIFSVTYSADEDAFFALTSGSRLVRYDAQGRPAGSARLSAPVATSTYSLWDYQLVATQDRLALLTPLVANPLDPSGPKVQLSYLINPDTGDVTSLGAVRVVPEPHAAALFAACAIVGLRRRSVRRCSRG